ncbi:DUF3329 domain-containing protein [Mesorhizobium sp. BR1-1-16]|uniref:DUF3329 domain-containing protein n=1 Tax=Mesorhizobium sp. BR1-1-16 TaxID=2876653 RepID=UPI001CC8F870|nr:DUF3329 domain-containing protein [Mesorhizobium sp. BR1-1-16]MBZ9938337.1 DUF3329 domain-containing protein [Mesorhizobium sp. BR1-1-16]
MKSETERVFFGPLWRRVAMVALIAVWFGYEALFIRDPLWMVIVGGMLAYAAWTYLIRWDGSAPPENQP